MKKAIILSFTALVLFSCQSADRQPVSSGEEAIKPQPTYIKIENLTDLQDIIKSENQSMDIIREKPWLYWSWSKTQVGLFFKKQLNYQGYVSGDPHSYNFGDLMNSKKKAEFSLVDVDDSGYAPLILDFAKYALFLEEKNSSPELDEVLASYISGLKNEALQMPDFLQKEMAVSFVERQKRQQKETKELIKNGQFDYAELNMKPYEELKVEDQKTSGELVDYLVNVKKSADIADAGMMVDESGNSAGVKRFWYLLQKGKNLEAIEFKELLVPAVAFYVQQDDTLKRLKSVQSHYQPQDMPDYAVVKIKERYFWMRPRKVQLWKKSVIKDLEKDQKREYQKYIAWWLGQKHGAQSKSYVEAVVNNEATVLKDLQEFSKAFRKYTEK